VPADDAGLDPWMSWPGTRIYMRSTGSLELFQEYERIGSTAPILYGRRSDIVGGNWGSSADATPALRGRNDHARRAFQSLSPSSRRKIVIDTVNAPTFDAGNNFWILGVSGAGQIDMIRC